MGYSVTQQISFGGGQRWTPGSDTRRQHKKTRTVDFRSADSFGILAGKSQNFIRFTLAEFATVQQSMENRPNPRLKATFRQALHILVPFAWLKIKEQLITVVPVCAYLI